MFTIFLVDDDAGVLKALSRLLRAKGHDVRPFGSPREFLAQHDAALPGCAVLDVSMPGLDGLELQQALMAGGPGRRGTFFYGGGGNCAPGGGALGGGAIFFRPNPVEKKERRGGSARAGGRAREPRQDYAEV